MGVVYRSATLEVATVSRAEWGASADTERFIADRFSAGELEKTSIQIHHTAGADSDTTANEWGYAEAVAYMKRLEWVRPDLGPLPYSYNPAAAEDGKTVWLFEGRGALKVGAHTAGHNRDGVGYGILGNFTLAAPADARLRIVRAIEVHAGGLRSGGLERLGTLLNPKGWQAWGHSDSKATSCPGHGIYPLLEDFHLADNGGDDEDMEHNIEAMKKFGTAFWQRCQQVAGEPKPIGLASAQYWGYESAHAPGLPTQQEWVDAYPVLWPAALRTMAAGSAGGAHTHTATTTATTKIT